MPHTDTVTAPAIASPANTRDWIAILARYRQPSHVRSFFELAITLGPLALLWTGMWLALGYSYWLCLLLAVPAAGFLMRLFMIQHDCGHGAFFRQRLLNDWLGRIIGVVTLTPYDFWRRTHNIHHATSGNLDRRGIGDVTTLTVKEYLARSRWQRLTYRLYRNPVILFGVGPAYLFILQHRLPVGLMRDGAGPWISTMMTNGAIAVIVAGLMWMIGVGPFLLIHLPIIVIGGAVGVWLFYVQHQFEDTVWSGGETWSLPDAALHGSSHYDLPAVLRWFTANIGVHHVHHLCSRIPYYRLPQVMREHPEFGAVGRVTLLQSVKCVRLTLWDEDRQRLVSFREIGALRAAAARCSSHTSAGSPQVATSMS